MKRTTNPVWLWHPRGSVIKHVWIAINQDKKRRPIRPRLAQAKTTSKRREREPTSGEREAATSLERKGNPFLFPSRCNLSFYVFSRFPISCRIRISTLSIYLYLVILI